MPPESLGLLFLGARLLLGRHGFRTDPNKLLIGAFLPAIRLHHQWRENGPSQETDA